MGPRLREDEPPARQALRLPPRRRSARPGRAGQVRRWAVVAGRRLPGQGDDSGGAVAWSQRDGAEGVAENVPHQLGQRSPSSAQRWRYPSSSPATALQTAKAAFSATIRGCGSAVMRAALSAQLAPPSTRLTRSIRRCWPASTSARVASPSANRWLRTTRNWSSSAASLFQMCRQQAQANRRSLRRHSLRRAAFVSRQI